MRQFTVTKQEDGMRLNRWLEKTAPRLSGALMYRFLRTKHIKVNGKRAEAGDRLRAGDVVTTFISDDFFVSDRPKYRFLGAASKLTVLYEDEQIALLYKPAGIAVHDEEGGTADTLVNRLLRYLYEKGEFDPEEAGCFVPALCNRLDTGTFGIVIAAKTRAALAEMNAVIKQRLIDKRYLAAVVGRPPEGRFTAYLEKNEQKNMVTVRERPFGSARQIVTGVRVLKSSGELSLCEIELITGRTHQIRAHLAFLDCPVLGDGKYGRGEINRRYGLRRQALCAYKLTFALGGRAADFPTLAYLDGSVTTVPSVWFAEEYFGERTGGSR